MFPFILEIVFCISFSSHKYGSIYYAFNNYGTNSKMSVMSKVFEVLITVTFSTLMINCGLNCRHGFRFKRFITTNNPLF